MNVIALVKNGERFIFLYDDNGVDQLLQTLGRYAADSDLNFTWYDAAVLSQRVRKLTHEQLPKQTRRRARASFPEVRDESGFGGQQEAA